MRRATSAIISPHSAENLSLDVWIQKHFFFPPKASDEGKDSVSKRERERNFYKHMKETVARRVAAEE